MDEATQPTSASKTALIIGGSGKVARALTPLLTGATPNPWRVYSLIRSSSQADSLRALGAEPIILSLEEASVSELSSTLTKTLPDVVIFLAGAGGGDASRTERVDHEGAVKSMDACARAGVKRYIQVSALDMRDRNLDPPSWYNADDLAQSERLWTTLGSYMRAKLAADKELVQGNGERGLEWTIVRPGHLTDEAGKGTVQAGQVHLERTISREDVAAVVLECVRNDGTAGLAFDVLGGDVDVKTAVAKVVAGREDCFQGYF